MFANNRSAGELNRICHVSESGRKSNVCLKSSEALGIGYGYGHYHAGSAYQNLGVHKPQHIRMVADGNFAMHHLAGNILASSIANDGLCKIHRIHANARRLQIEYKTD